MRKTKLGDNQLTQLTSSGATQAEVPACERRHACADYLPKQQSRLDHIGLVFCEGTICER